MLYLDLKHKEKSKFLQKTWWFVSSGWVAHKVLICVISFKSTEKENLWDSNKDLRLSMFEEWTPPLSCVFYIIFRKRKKHFWHCYLQGTTARLGVQMSPVCRGSPKWGVPGSHSPALFLCLQTVPHNEIGDTWCHPPAAQSSCTFIKRDKNNSVSV